MSQPTRACPTCQTPLPGMAAYCYVCGTETPVGMMKETGERVAVGHSGISPKDLLKKLQRALGPGYELQDRIGAGGFAEVFKVRDLRLKRDLAVKVLRPDLGLSPDLVMRFRREAETIANLRHPHIVPVYDVGEAEGLAYLIMPLIAGENLRTVMEREGAMPVAEVQRILREACSGLAAAHDAGIVHRDIKPENVMLEGVEKRVLLMDFGIAKVVGGGSGEDGDPSEGLTSTGIIIGTPQYMSPEQACGDKSIDARSDQYSLAVVGYRMLSGTLPFDGESTRAVLYQQLVGEPKPLIERMPDLPGPVAVAIQRAMAKEPNERFASMREFATMLDGDSTLTTAPSAAAVAAHSSSRRVTVLMSAVALLALVGWYLSNRSPAPGETAVAPAPVPEVTGDSAAVPPGTPLATAQPATTPPAAAGKPAAGTTRPTTTAKPPTVPAPTPKAATTAAAPTGVSCTRAASNGDWLGAAGACATEAAAGSAVAQRILGSLYDRGSGVNADPAKAVEWYRKASSGGDLEAKLALSRLLEIGRGVPANQGESIALLREAAAGGLLRAQQTLAFRLENGGGIKKDEAEAALWYRRAAEQGDMAGQEKLADFLARGRGVTKNEAEALEWYKKAAEKGSAESAWQAAQAYFRGRGTAKDEAAGMEWLKRAAARNHTEAKKELAKRGG
ncbi:MAG: serine/threonine-protein kinase [Gemmatimonadales bacterium]|nr:serine/threonine-protein kinase [Gemmatimonadales bacterium]